MGEIGLRRGREKVLRCRNVAGENENKGLRGRAVGPRGESGSANMLADVDGGACRVDKAAHAVAKLTLVTMRNRGH